MLVLAAAAETALAQRQQANKAATSKHLEFTGGILTGVPVRGNTL